jgi:hypothetical protein
LRRRYTDLDGVGDTDSSMPKIFSTQGGLADGYGRRAIANSRAARSGQLQQFAIQREARLTLS